MIALTKHCIFLEIMLIGKSHFMLTLHIMVETIKAHMSCVGQTNPKILRSEVLSPISEGEPEVTTF